jgi:alcohol dehydrogenase class IV
MSAARAGAGEFAAPTRIIAGRGCASTLLGAELRALRVDTVAVVADRGFAQAGLLEHLLAGIDDVAVPVCALIGEDPGIAETEQAALSALRHDAGAVLAVGGGSAMCAAKGVAIRLRNPAPLDAYEGSGRLPVAPAPSIAVPTTAGSGSEVSNVVVLHDPGRERHLVIRGHGYEPRVALLDGELLRSLPARPMVAAALDALSHALEALWARRATRFSDALALTAASSIRSALPRALAGEVDAMQQLIEASAMANLACGNSGLGLVHALSSAPDVHLAHGYQNGVLLPHVAAFNRPRVGAAAASEIDELEALYREIGFRESFAREELSARDGELMVAAAMSNPFRDNNLRAAGEADLRDLLAGAGAPLPRG